MKVSRSILFLLVLPACGVTRNRAIGTYPDGSIAQAVDCRRDHPEKCIQRSQELCQPYTNGPQVIRPLAYDASQARWRMVVTCGPPIVRQSSAPGMAVRPSAPAPNTVDPPTGPQPAAIGVTPLPPSTPSSSGVPQ